MEAQPGSLPVVKDIEFVGEEHLPRLRRVVEELLEEEVGANEDLRPILTALKEAP